MVELPPMSQVGVVRLSREGGLAYIPARIPRRTFELASCSQTLRDQVCCAVEEASQTGQTPRSACSSDQRFFRIELALCESPEAVLCSFEVPEVDAPQALVALLQTAAGEKGVSSDTPGR